MRPQKRAALPGDLTPEIYLVGVYADNGFLTFHKVLKLKLDADLVTLAACMTGVGQVTQGKAC